MQAEGSGEIHQSFGPKQTKSSNYQLRTLDGGRLGQTRRRRKDQNNVQQEVDDNLIQEVDDTEDRTGDGAGPSSEGADVPDEAMARDPPQRPKRPGRRNTWTVSIFRLCFPPVN